MAVPTITDFILYTTTPLTNTDWAANWNKVVDYVTNGTFDFTTNKLTLTTDLIAGGDATITGAVTAATLIGDGAGITNIAGLYLWGLIGGD